jgi:hypothetical protein
MVDMTEERVWKYLITNQTATPGDVALNCDVTEDYARRIIDRIGTPIEVRQATAEQTTGYPDDNPKTIYGEAKFRISDTPVNSIRLLGLVHNNGAKKYGALNWRDHTVSASVYYNAAWRHMAAWYEGEDLDPESGLPHLAHVMACMSIILDAGKFGKLNDDRPTTQTGEV